MFYFSFDNESVLTPAKLKKQKNCKKKVTPQKEKQSKCREKLTTNSRSNVKAKQGKESEVVRPPVSMQQQEGLIILRLTPRG